MHETVQSTTMFYRKRETRNQVYNCEISAKSSSHNQLKNVINIKNNLLLKKQVDEKSEVFNHTYDTFKLNENEIEIDCINSISTAKKLKKIIEIVNRISRTRSRNC